jgi:hypothetical protein
MPLRRGCIFFAELAVSGTGLKANCSWNRQMGLLADAFAPLHLTRLAAERKL